ncbi:MAG: hypothetical protein IKX68_08295 [Clostridiales bacterium]|nr:hypothetical protein [Clostridiales bacterium]
MKQINIFVLLFCVCLMLTSCKIDRAGNHAAGGNTNNVQAVLQSGIEEEEKKKSEITTAYSEASFNLTNPTTSQDPDQTQDPIPSESSKSADGIDLDLTEMSATMVYSEVLGMVYEPDSYRGKVVKMSGDFSYYQDEQTGKYYFACIVKDATECCAQGIEYSLKGEYSFPEDYPELGDPVTVVGTFDTYEEGGYVYMYLKDAYYA